jgi:UDP-glucose 4-epimerase
MMSPARPTIGITGGSGYIGSSLARFLAVDFSVKVLDVREPQRVGNQVEYSYCDVRRRSDVENALKDIDLVIHSAIVQIPMINEQQRLAYQVNIEGTQNVCDVVDKSPSIKGMILSGSWHTIGERNLSGTIDEEFGFRPDKVEDRARLYALSKIAQESIVRFYDEMSDKTFAIIRMGTVLGDGMPEKTAANIFIERGLRGETLTPYKHTMHRPMLYVDINDICLAYRRFATGILEGRIKKSRSSLAHIINVYCTKPTTILELAEIVRKAIAKHTRAPGPRIEVIDTGQPLLFKQEDKNQITVDLSKAISILGLMKLIDPEQSVEEIVRMRVHKMSGTR